MKRLFPALFVLAGCVLLYTGSASAEFIFIKDGSILDERIVDETRTHVIIQVKDGTKKKIARNNIIRIAYNNQFMARIALHLSSGAVMDGFIVDEDRENYIMRRNLYSPEEIPIAKNMVLSQTRVTPSNLKGVPGIGSVALTWNPPLGSVVKVYKVFIKDEAGTYRLATETGSPKTTIRDLKPATTYTFTVIAVDRDGKESTASNEEKVLTLDTPLPKVTGLVMERRTSPDGKKLDVKLTWKDATTDDKRVTGYTIYQMKEGAFKSIGATQKTEYEITGLDPNLNYQFMIKTKSARNIESAESETVRTQHFPPFTLSARFGFLYPVSDMADIADYGFGAMIGVGMPNIWKGLYAGLEWGYYEFHCAEDIDHAAMVPVAIRLQYDIDIITGLTVSPVLYGGYTWASITYIESDEAAFAKYKRTKDRFEPFVAAGVQCGYDITRRVTITANVDCTMIIEKTPMLFMGFSLGAGVRL